LFRKIPAAAAAPPASVIVASPAQASSSARAAERRASPRRWGDPVEVFLWENRSGGEPERGWVLNRSQGGLGIRLGRTFAEGALLELRLATAPAAVPWILIEVKAVTPHTGRFLLHCRFVEQPPAEVMVLLR
jgi:hypothetical protein